jgi:hypothetical protein
VVTSYNCAAFQLTTAPVETSPHGTTWAFGPAGGPCLAWACLDVMELAGRLAQQHAHELKEVLRLPGDRANQARTQLQALVQALHHVLSTSSSRVDMEERGSDGAMAMEEEGGERSMEEVSLGHRGRACIP